MRLFGRVRPRPRVRAHLRGADPSIDGFLRRPYPVDGFYVIDDPRMVEAPDRTFSLEGVVKVPQANVLFFQELAPE